MLSIHSWPSSNSEHSRLYSTAQTIVFIPYCNSLFLNLPRCQLDRLQLILNSTAQAVSKTPFSAISHQSSNLYTGSKLISASTTVFSPTYKTLQSQKPSYLYLQANTSTHSSTVITLQRPPVNSRLKITDRSFTYHALAFWNSLPKDLPTLYLGVFCTNLSDSTNHHLLAILRISVSLQTSDSSLPPIIPALVCLHSWFSGSLNLALFSFHITIIITASLHHSYHLISFAIRPIIYIVP